jgi:hypothetical protein
MAKEAAGLSFSNPFMEKTNVGEIPNPYAPYSPTSSIGLGGLGPSAADMAMVGESMVKQSQFTMPEMKRPAAIAFSPTENKLFVNGLTFGADDAATALQSESYLRGPGTQLPTGGDWVPLDEQAYGQYLSGIRNPGLGRLASKNFGRGVDVMQLLAGRGLQLAGAEETGGAIVNRKWKTCVRPPPMKEWQPMLSQVQMLSTGLSLTLPSKDQILLSLFSLLVQVFLQELQLVVLLLVLVLPLLVLWGKKPSNNPLLPPLKRK